MMSTASKSLAALPVGTIELQASTAVAAARSIDKTNVRLPFLDLMRAVASQCIVLHHLVFYGPLPERAHAALPVLFDWLHDHARMAVQVFFVLGGFFTSRGLCKGKRLSAKSVSSAIWGRYRRIGFPYLATLIVAIVANELARSWMTHEAISERPTMPQLLAHAAFMHDVLGYPALSAGIWYLAIDFQLFLVTLGLFWLAQTWMNRPNATDTREVHRALVRLMAPLALASLFWFNRHPRYDIWAIYFVGSYFLGIVLHGLLEQSLKLSWASLYLFLVVLAGLIDPRPRLLVAAGTATLVYVAARTGVLYAWPKSRFINYLGRITYSLFLMHFPVLLVVYAWGSHCLMTSTSSAIGGLVMAYVLSLAAGVALYHGIESRIR